MNIKKAFFIFFMLETTLQIHGYYSQIGQDKYLNENFFHNKKKGVFIDIGAYDGITHSNTYFFEKELGWTGICFEPIPRLYEKLRKNRNCRCVNACVANAKGTVDFLFVDGVPEMLSGMLQTYDARQFERVKYETAHDGGTYYSIKLPSVTFNDVLAENGITYIDFLSLDTEGSELMILQSIDFNKVTIYAISVENNFGESKIRELLESKGFQYITRLAKQDEVYINAKLIKN